ncbi:MAG: InlB B-repeat-containing protein [Lachnospiraceae bacterium]|nr:InlB B-repeat-containing protein [Lachnospiraceae bacterium]
MEDSAISSSGEVTLRTNGFSRSGYTFAGWATSADGSAQYTNGQRITGLTSLTSDLNLYAKWTANSSDDSSSRSSSSSSTSSGNSTTKVSTNSSGEKVTTTTTKQGTVTTVTQTTAKKDGSKEVVKTSTDSKTGKVTETKTTTKTDGSKEEVKTVTNKDGSKSVTETDTAADKSQAIVETEVTAAGDVTIVTSTVNSSGTKTSEATYTATDEDTVKITNIEVTGKTVTIPAAVTAAGDKYKVTRIGAGALKGNDKVTKVVIGKNIKAIGAKAFADTPKLKTIVLQGAKVKSIGKGAFDGINKKATIKIKGTAKQVKAVRKLIQKSGVAKTVKIKRVKK